MKEKFSFSALLIMTSLFAVSSAQANDEDRESVTVIEVNAANEYVAGHENTVIMDVRTPVEYEMSHITGSVNVNVQDESFENTVKALDPDKTYIVHCTKNPGNGRSSRALKTLKSLGFKNLYSLEGGYVAWKDAELPLTDAAN